MVVLLIWCLSQLSMVSSIEYIIPAVGFGDEDVMNSTLLISNTGASSLVVNGGFNFNNSMEQTFTESVGSNTVLEIPIPSVPKEYLLNGSEIANKSIVINSTSHYMGVHLITGTSFHVEGVAAISTDRLGTKYFVSTFCALGGYCQIGIATVKANTTRLYVQLPDEVQEVSICVGKQTWNSADRSFHLVYPETVQIESPDDLTGTYIYSDQPISVVAGTRSMPAHNPAKLLHFYEQLSPIPHWGTKFVVRGFGTEFGCIVHITAQEQFTFVDMTGYNTTEASTGYTIRRRLEKDTVAYIEASKAVQVVIYSGITYGSSETIQSVAMTTLPAVEHFQTSYVASCGPGYTTYQYIAVKDNEPTSTLEGAKTSVHLTEYNVVEITKSVPNPLVTASQPFGGIMECHSALFPLAPPLKATLSPACIISFARLNHGDGLDSNCDGSIDEGTCYENVKITTKFEANDTGYIPAHTADVRHFYQILIRVQSCDITQIELLFNYTTTLVIHLSSSSISMYTCNDSTCVYVGGIATTSMTQNTTCSKAVRSYWITQAYDKICVNIGNSNMDGHCTYQPLSVPVNMTLDQMRLSGLTGDSIIWYDLYKPDCGQLMSDWRCHDVIPDCHKYTADLCTNPSYAEWVDFYCKKFCGLCSPDHYGRMFVYIPAPVYLHNATQQLVFLGSNGETSKIGLETSAGFIETESLNISAYNSLTVDAAIAKVDDIDGPIRIFTEDDVVVAYIFNDRAEGYVQPIDVLGTEYMTISFSDGATDATDGLECYFIPLSPDTKFYMFSYSSYSEWNGAFLTNLLDGNQTGTVIKGNQPFSAWCGTSSLSSYGFSWYALSPTNTWGTLYMTPSIGSNISNSVLSKMRIVTNSNSTVIQLNGEFDGIYELPARGDFKEFDIDPSIVYRIESNFPVAVAVIYYRDGNQQDSSLHVLPPVASFADAPLILFGYEPTDMWISITPTTYTINGSANTEDEIFVSNIELEPGLYTYQQNQSNTTNGSFLFSYRKSVMSVSIAASTHLFKDLSLGRICHLSPDTVADGIDNDCDGTIDDEATCITGYATIKTDSDLDGNFGEDCELVTAGTSLAQPPPTPNCALVESDVFACAEYCQCDCSWKHSLEQYNNMSIMQQDAYNDAAIEIYKKALKIDKSTLSATVSQRESADDERQSSQNIGWAGLLMIVTVIGFITAFDLITLIQKIRSKFTSTNVQTVS